MRRLTQSFLRPANLLDGSKIVISVASPEDIKAIVDCTNDAFMADTFFKKPEYHLRFTEGAFRLYS
jgi:hypothetical protein